MIKNEVENILCKAYTKEFAKALLNSFESVINCYKAENMHEMSRFAKEFAQIVLGHFLKQQSVGSANENCAQLLCEEMNTLKDEQNTFKINVLSSLVLMQSIKNDNATRQTNVQNKNSTNAFMVLNVCKFILTQFIIENSDERFDNSSEIVNSLLEKDIALVWSTGKNLKVLSNKMSCKQKVLCLLYMKNLQSTSELLAACEYANETVFKMYLKELHAKNMLEYLNDKCNISPLGKKEAERLFSKY